jgi:transmembrane sensor
MERIDYLYEQYLAQRLSPPELTELRSLLQQADYAQRFEGVLDEHWDRLADQDLIAMPNAAKERIYSSIISEPQVKVKSRKLWYAISTVAAVIAIVCGVYLFNANRLPDASSSRTAGRDLLNDIAPGKNGATITLANGEVIQLNGAKKGVIIGEELKYDDHTLVTSRYTSSRGNERSLDPAGSRQSRDDGNVQFLTAQTQKGQTYTFTLPDGTKVWLNAASTIKFPANFKGLTTRPVSLSGEAYFEVARNGKQPFRVESDGQVVEDIGTAFNINAYVDEGTVRTTLVEGSASVTPLGESTFTNAEKAIILKPNQQAILEGELPGGQSGGRKLKIIPVVAETYIDWKEGAINFRKEQLQSIMRKVSRWYDVEVVYKDIDDDGQTFTGYVARTENVSKVLEALAKLSDLKFKIEGRKIIVSK